MVVTRYIRSHRVVAALSVNTVHRSGFAQLAELGGGRASDRRTDGSHTGGGIGWLHSLRAAFWHGMLAEEVARCVHGCAKIGVQTIALGDSRQVIDCTLVNDMEVLRNLQHLLDGGTRFFDTLIGSVGQTQTVSILDAVSDSFGRLKVMGIGFESLVERIDSCVMCLLCLFGGSLERLVLHGNNLLLLLS